MIDEFNVVVAGVGGQGVILLSELLGEAALAMGHRVHGSEVLGMAVRGGRVTSAIRLGQHVHGPLISPGRVDLLIALEPAEGLVHAHTLGPDGRAVVNTRPVVPFTVSLGQCRYPSSDQILTHLDRLAGRLLAVDADAVAAEIGAPRAANVVLLGAAAAMGRLPVEPDALHQAIRRRFRGATAELNSTAFEAGFRRAGPAGGDLEPS